MSHLEVSVDGRTVSESSRMERDRSVRTINFYQVKRWPTNHHEECEEGKVVNLSKSGNRIQSCSVGYYDHKAHCGHTKPCQGRWQGGVVVCRS